MPDYMEAARIEQKDLVDNSANRVVVCLCVDTSLSMMKEGRIKHVNNGIRKFIEESKHDIYAVDAIDICLITFGGTNAKIEIPFSSVKDVCFRDLKPDGATPLGEAVKFAIDQIEERQQEYSNHGISCYKPWLIIMSDGAATDSISDSVTLVRNRLAQRKLKVMCVDMSNGKEINDLKRFTSDGEINTIDSFKIEDFFLMLSRSVAGLSTTSIGEDEFNSILTV